MTIRVPFCKTLLPPCNGGARRGVLTFAANALPDGMSGMVGAVNVALVGDVGQGTADGQEIAIADRWFQVSPFGEFPNKAGLQVFDVAAANEIVTNFRAWSERVGRLFRGLPIYLGHPDHEPDKYPDKRRYGSIIELEARADGLWAKPKWNPLGRVAVNEEHFLYQSPYWGMRQITLPGGKRAFRPALLESAGLTNNPNIPGLPVGANEQPQPTHTTADPMKDKLIKRFNLVPLEGATEVSDEQVEAALTNAANEKAELDRQFKAANDAKTKAEKERDDERNARRDGLLTAAVNEKRITEGERAGWVTRFDTAFDAAAKALGDLKPAVNTRENAHTASLATREKGVTGAASTNDQLTAAVNEALPKHNGNYDAAWAAVKRAKPDLFKAANANP